jgi:hypothetical protein
MGQGKYDLRSSDDSQTNVPGSIPASVRQVPVDNNRTIPDDSRRSPMLNLRYQELGQCVQHG